MHEQPTTETADERRDDAADERSITTTTKPRVCGEPGRVCGDGGICGESREEH